MKSLVLLPVFLLTAMATAAPTTNPADLYRQAFAKLDSIKKAPQLDDVDKTPLDANTTKFLADHSGEIDLLRQAVKIPPARWGDPQGEIDNLLSSLSNARTAANLLALQTRWDLRQSRPAQAADDALAQLALAHNVAQARPSICSLVQFAIESRASDQIGGMVPTLPKEVATSLQPKIAALPGAPTGREVMAAEFAWGRAMVDKQNIPLSIFEAAHPFYRTVGDAMDQPQAQFEQTVDAEAMKLMLNPFVKSIAPSIKRFHVAMLGADAKRAMLDTAIAITLKGEGAVARSKDPAGDGPFAYAKTANGFTLTSKAVDHRERPVVLRVGG